MTVTLIWLTSIWLTALAQAPAQAAQQPSALAAQQPSTKLATVSGTVLHGVNKQPLRKAEVRLVAGGQGRSMVVATGEEGRFEFKDVEPGVYFLTGRRNGFVEGSGSGPRGNPGTRIEVGSKDLSGLRVELTPQAIIAGRVVDEDGEPLQGILVQAVGSQPFRTQRRLLPLTAVQTDDRGEFRLLNLNPGAYLLQFTPSRWGGGPTGATEDDPGLGYVPMYYPGVNDARQAEKVRVSAGAELSGFQLRLTRTRVVRLRGRILDPDGQPLKQFFLQLLPRDSPVMGFTPPQMNRLRDGAFEVRNVVPGAYSMLVRTQGGPRGGLGYREPIDVGSRDMVDLVIRLTPPTTVSGRVELPPNASIDVARLRVGLMDAQTSLSIGDTLVRADGTFQLDNVPPGPYRIQMPLPDGAFVASIRAGEQEILGQEFHVPSAGAPPVRIQLSTDVGTVSGAIFEDSKPVPDLKVVLLPADKALWRADRIRTVTADSAGRFTFKSAAPGDYTVYAFRELEPGIWEDEEEFRRFEAGGKKVAVRKGATETLEVNPVP